VPASVYILILCSLQAFIIAWMAQWSPEYKIGNDRISMHPRRVWAFGIGDYCPYLMMY